MKTSKDDLDVYINKAKKKDPSLKERLKKAAEAWKISFQIINLREKAGLTQQQLAKLIGTSQSNIARIESADYTSHTVKSLEKVTQALKARLEIKIVPLKPIKEIKKNEKKSVIQISL